MNAQDDEVTTLAWHQTSKNPWFLPKSSNSPWTAQNPIFRIGYHFVPNCRAKAASRRWRLRWTGFTLHDPRAAWLYRVTQSKLETGMVESLIHAGFSCHPRTRLCPNCCAVGCDSLVYLPPSDCFRQRWHRRSVGRLVAYVHRPRLVLDASPSPHPVLRHLRSCDLLDRYSENDVRQRFSSASVFGERPRFSRALGRICRDVGSRRHASLCAF